MKKEQRDALKKIRYFKVFEDCGCVSFNHIGLEIKKGDIIKILNDSLENFVFDIHGGLLDTLGYRFFGYDGNEGIPGIFNVVKYPEDKPLNIGEYIKIQPPFNLPEESEIHVVMKPDHAAYLSPEILDKFLNDSKHSVMLMDKTYMNVSEYNKKTLLNFGGKLNYHSPGVKLIESGDVTSSSNNNELKTQNSNTKNLSRILEKVKPGCYTTDSLLIFAFFIEGGETIDLSRPEYSFLAVNQDFMRLMANSEEITNPKQKQRIYERQQKDFLPNTKYRYYRLKDDVNVKDPRQLHESFGYLLNSDDAKKIGHNFNPGRVIGDVEVVEETPERISLIKVKYTSSTICDIVDRELRKISKRLTKREATSINLQEVSKNQRLKEEENAKKTTNKGKDYFRIKMIADLAATYIKDQPPTEEFKKKAFEYYLNNKKLYLDTMKILGYLDDFSWDVFYMIHLIKTENKDNRIIDSAYKEKLQEKRNAFTSVLGNVLKKYDTER